MDTLQLHIPTTTRDQLYDRMKQAAALHGSTSWELGQQTTVLVFKRRFRKPLTEQVDSIDLNDDLRLLIYKDVDLVFVGRRYRRWGRRYRGVFERMTHHQFIAQGIIGTDSSAEAAGAKDALHWVIEELVTAFLLKHGVKPA